jgi:hypothetical protein
MTAAKTKNPRTPGRQARRSVAIRARRGADAGSFFFEARHDQGLEGDRAAVGAGMFVGLLVALFLRRHLRCGPLTSIYPEPRTLDVFAISVPPDNFAIGITLRHIIVCAIVGNFNLFSTR